MSTDRLSESLSALATLADRHGAKAALVNDTPLCSELFGLADELRVMADSVERHGSELAAHQLLHSGQRQLALARTSIDQQETSSRDVLRRRFTVHLRRSERAHRQRGLMH